MYKIIHLDDEKQELEIFRKFLSKAKFDFELQSFADPISALDKILEDKDITLCIVDLRLDSHKTLNGIRFVETAKLVSPTTAFIILSSDTTTKMQRLSAQVGCRAIFKKRWLEDQNLEIRILSEIEHACYHSELFLKRNSKSLLTFSNTIAHKLQSELQTNKRLVEILYRQVTKLKSAKKQPSQSSEKLFKAAAKHYNHLMDRYSIIRHKLISALNFYTRNEVKPENCSINQIVADVLNDSMHKNRLKLSSNLKDSSARVDKVLIKTCLENLIDNAVKFTDSVPGAETIDISLDDFGTGDESYIEFTVRDYGFGILEDEKHKLILANYTGSTGGPQIASFGIGLAEVDQIVRLHRNLSISGFLTINNTKVGRGCIVVMRIPRNCRVR